MSFEFVHEGEALRSMIEEQFKAFLQRHHAGQVEAILAEMDPNRHYAVPVHALDLVAHNMVLGDLLVHRPEETLRAFDGAVSDYQCEMLEHFQQNGDPAAYSMVAKPCAHVRVHSLPRCAELSKPTISSIRTEDVGHFLSLSGTVTRAAAVRMLHAERKVACAKCGLVHRVRADLERHNEMALPAECGNEEGAKRCASTTFNPVDGTEVCRDYQEIRVQEQVQRLSVGAVPRSMVVVLEDDLVDAAKPGDDVLVTGVVVRRWRPLRAESRPEIELVLRANHVTVCNQLVGAGLVTAETVAQFDAFWRFHGDGPHRMVGRDLVLRAVCPGLSGLFLVKLALALALLGGVNRTDASGQRIRGEVHLLLIGDPGTGKSQVLKFAASLSPRSVMTTGIGSTSAGLTVTATKDSTGEWTLDAGALVLADGGVCCIDEFGTMREHDRTTIHEAMEQQTLSVAKAGLVCKLRTKTTIVAATNPKDKGLDGAFSLTANAGIAAPLLSRFDVALLLADDHDEAWDSAIADFILDRDREAPRAGEGGAPAAGVSLHGVDAEAVWDEDTLRAYFECARRQFEPVMTPAAEEVLSRYFESQRQSELRNAARTTIRLLESLIRLAQAHARLMWRGTVEVVDAVYAIVLAEAGADPAADGPLRSVEGGLSAARSTFPDPSRSAVEAQGVEEHVLSWLGIGPHGYAPPDQDAAGGSPSDPLVAAAPVVGRSPLAAALHPNAPHSQAAVEGNPLKRALDKDPGAAGAHAPDPSFGFELLRGNVMAPGQAWPTAGPGPLPAAAADAGLGPLPGPSKPASALQQMPAQGACHFGGGDMWMGLDNGDDPWGATPDLFAAGQLEGSGVRASNVVAPTEVAPALGIPVENPWSTTHDDLF